MWCDCVVVLFAGERGASGGGGRVSGGGPAGGGASALADRRPDSLTEERGLERLQGGQPAAQTPSEDADT